MVSRTSNLADVAAQFLFSVIGRGCYLALQVLLARNLGPREFGLYAVGWTVTGLVGTFAPVGMTQAVLRYGVAGRQALRAAPVAVAAAFGLFCFAALSVAAGPVARGLFGEVGATSVILALAPSVPLFGVLGVLTASLRASQANLASAVVGALLFAIHLGLTAIAFAGGAGRTPAVAGHAYTVALVLTLLPAIWLLHRLPPPPGAGMPRLQHLMRFGIVTMFIHSANVLNLWADRLVIGALADAQAVGVYQVASQMAMVALVLRAAVTSVFEARVPKLAHGAGTPPPDVTREFLAASRVLLHVSVPGLVCLALTARFWTGTLFGADYRAAAVPLAILLIGQLALTFTGPSMAALQMTGEERTALSLTTSTCLLNLLGNVALIPLFGLAGSAVASGFANLAAGGGSLWRLRRTGRLRPYFAAVGDIVLGTAACAAVTALATFWLGANSLLAMAGVLAGAYAAYAVVVALFCQVEDETLDLARALLRRAREPRRTRRGMPAP